jgi:hypothetical protein
LPIADEEQLSEFLCEASPTLKEDKSKRLAQEILDLNDVGKFEEAWQTAETALEGLE